MNSKALNKYQSQFFVVIKTSCFNGLLKWELRSPSLFHIFSNDIYFHTGSSDDRERDNSLRLVWLLHLDASFVLLQVQSSTGPPLDTHPENDAGISRIHAHILNHQHGGWNIHSGFNKQDLWLTPGYFLPTIRKQTLKIFSSNKKNSKNYSKFALKLKKKWYFLNFCKH